jgi:hypothetical protein
MQTRVRARRHDIAASLAPRFSLIFLATTLAEPTAGAGGTGSAGPWQTGCPARRARGGQRELRDHPEHILDGVGEPLPATSMVRVVVTNVRGQLARGRRPEQDHFTRLRFTSLHGMPGAPSRASWARRRISALILCELARRQLAVCL